MSQSIIRCVVDIFAKPESVEQVRILLLNTLTSTRAEDGCIEVNLFQNLKDTFQFTLMEQWENEDAFEDHLLSDHIRQVGIDIKDFLSKDPDVRRYKNIPYSTKKINSRRNSRFCILI